jgi:hypothetical protein
MSFQIDIKKATSVDGYNLFLTIDNQEFVIFLTEEDKQDIINKLSK